jgi:2-C-methyl-D-erythritol 2,4-cyclodiphosphate synthase
MNFRIGFGFDTHKLEDGRQCLLGGVLIPNARGPAGHSDADALIHAIIDALLGAAALRDIGFHFPDSSPEFKDIESRILLSRTCGMIRSAGYEIGNIDSTVVLQAPKISKYIPDMVSALAHIMNIPPGSVSVKAKTSERLGFIGREEGLSVYAVALLISS